MTPQTWMVIAQELILFAYGEETGATSIAVPVTHAQRVSRVLDNPWPGSMWPWTWTTSAKRAADDAERIDQSIQQTLDSDVAPAGGPEAVLRELEACGFTRTLLPAQADAVARLVDACNGGNFSVPGSGKTTMTLAVFALLRHRGVADRMVVIAPSSAYGAWTEEARECFTTARQPVVEITPSSPSRAADLVVYNYERMAKGSVRAAIDGWSHGRRLMVVFDEAHRAKRGVSGLHGAAARDLATMGAARFALTGTPMPNGRADLAAILDLAWPGQGNRLADPATPNADRSWVRITKHDLGLDEPDIDVEFVELDPAHRAVYDVLASNLRAHDRLIEQYPSLASKATARLIAAASNPALLLPREDDPALSWAAAVDEPTSVAEAMMHLQSVVRPTKILRVVQYAHEHHERGEKLLIWTNFLGNISELERLLAPLEPAVVAGHVPLSDASAPRDRNRELHRFRTDKACAVLIATPQTLGEGVSLHRACQSQIHLDRSFNAGLFLQAIDRTHRVGMPPGTRARVKVLVSDGTIDAAVHERLSIKILQMNAVLQDQSLRRLALRDPNDASSPLRIGATEVRTLLRHLQPEAVESPS